MFTDMDNTETIRRTLFASPDLPRGRVAAFAMASAFRDIGRAIADAHSAPLLHDIRTTSGSCMARLCGSNRYEDIDAATAAAVLHARTLYRVGRTFPTVVDFFAYHFGLDERGNPRAA